MNKNLSSELIPNANLLTELPVYRVEERLKSSSQAHTLYKVSNGNIYFVLKGIKDTAGEIDKYTSLLHREYSILSSLDNPYIIHTHGIINHPDVGECILLEYIDGRTLDVYLKEKHTHKERRRIAIQILEALEYIHKKGIIHADLKMGNILVRNNGDYVVLIDFGLSDTDATIIKNQGYTESFASPEQKSQSETDFSTDIYSLGLILKDTFPKRYKRIIQKCTQTDKNKRYTNVADIRKAIEKQDRTRTILALLLPSMFLFSTLAFIAGLYIPQDSGKPQPKEVIVKTVKTIDTIYIQSVDSTQLKLQPILDSMRCEMDNLFQAYRAKVIKQKYADIAMQEYINPFCEKCIEISDKAKAQHPEFMVEIEGHYNNLYSLYMNEFSKLTNGKTFSFAQN